MNRRRALKQLCGLLVLGGSATLLTEDSFDHSLQLIGRAWLGKQPAERSQLIAMVGGSSNTLPDADAFLRRRQADFAAGRLAVVEGWVLAESEVALCALTVLEA